MFVWLMQIKLKKTQVLVLEVFHLKKIDVLVDKTFDRFKDVFAAAGHPNSIFKINNLDLLKITNGKTLDISE